MASMLNVINYISLVVGIVYANDVLSTTLMCKEIDGKIYLAFDIPEDWLQLQLKHKKNAVKFSYYLEPLYFQKTSPSIIQWKHKKYYISEKKKKLVTDLGYYRATEMLRTFNLRISLQTPTRTLSINKFHLKNRTQVFSKWNIGEQEHCFKKQRAFMHFRVQESCPNITIEWENYPYDQFYYMVKQRIELRSVTTKATIQSISQNNYEPHTYTFVNKESSTQYEVCIHSLYKERESKQCEKVCLCCGKEQIREIGGIKLQWLETLLISISIVCIIMSIAMLVMYLRKRKGKNTSDTNSLRAFSDENDLITAREMPEYVRINYVTSENYYFTGVTCKDSLS